MDQLLPVSSSSPVASLYKTKIRGMFTKTLLLTILVMVVSCEAQTFQYSRGWTNGKRSGAAQGPVSYSSGQGSSALFDVENGLVGVPLEDPSVMIPGYHLNLSPQGRIRPFDLSQFLNRRSGGSVLTNRKQPIWIGTVLGVEQENNSNNNADF